jgi:PAS domain S-box-containing protein
MGDSVGRWRDLVDSATVLIAVLRGPEHVFAYANPAYLRAVGRDVVGRPLREALPELVSQDPPSLLDLVYATGATIAMDEALVRLDRDGDGVAEESYFSFSYQPLRGADSAIDGVFVQALDVTEHVRARRAAEEISRRARADAEAALARTQALVEAVRVISAGGHDLDTTLDALVVQGRRVLVAQDVAINLWDPVSKTFIRRRPSALLDPGSPLAAVGLPALHDCFAREAIASRRAVVIPDLQGDPRVDPAIRAALPHVRGTLIVPLVADDAVIGMMTSRWTEPRPVGAAEVDLAEALGRHAAVAVRTARLVSEVREQAAQRERADALTAALASASTRREVASAVLRHGPAAVGAATGVVVLLSAPGDELELVATEGYPPEYAAQWRSFPLDAPLPLSAAVRDGQPIFLGSREELAARFPSVELPGYGYSAALAALPLIVRGRVLGGLGLGFVHPQAFGVVDRGWMINLAQRCALALDRACLHDAVHSSEERYRLVTEAGQTAVWEWDPMADHIVWSGAGLRLFGYLETDDTDVAWWRARVHPADRERVWSSLQAALNGTEASYQHQYRFRRMDGSYAHCRVLARIERDDDGRPRRILGMMSDVTALREAEHQRDRLAEALARAEERERVAMDLHDGVVQQLAGAGMMIAAAARGADPGAMLERARIAVGTANVSLRAYMEALQSDARSGETLACALNRVVSDLMQTTGIEITLRADAAAEDLIPTDAVAELAYIAREATANAVRHGGARTVAIVVRRTRGGVELAVRDDGRGFDLAVAVHGMGLPNMRRRAAMLGGRLSIASKPGRGTTVRLVIPARTAPERTT